jgi:hypothetical protein
MCRPAIWHYLLQLFALLSPQRLVFPSVLPCALFAGPLALPCTLPAPPRTALPTPARLPRLLGAPARPPPHLGGALLPPIMLSASPRLTAR